MMEWTVAPATPSVKPLPLLAANAPYVPGGTATWPTRLLSVRFRSVAKSPGLWLAELSVTFRVPVGAGGAGARGLPADAAGVDRGTRDA